MMWCASESPGEFMQNMHVMGSVQVEENKPTRAANYTGGDGSEPVA